MKILVLNIFLFIGLVAYAQDTSSVSIHKDARIDSLIKKHIRINDELTKNARKTEKGFRLLIVNTNSRDEALAAKAKVYAKFPELKLYLFHQTPYYKLKAGNFRDRKDAEIYQKRLEIMFPKGVFIMNDIIEVKPGKSEDETQL
jgi:regulatory protein YycI of two-component signal transduction system YycFG